MKLIKEDKYLLIVFLLMAIAIFVNTYFNSDGYLSSDSYRYLELAQNILKRNSFDVFSFGKNINERGFYSIQPVGYSFLIFIMAKFTGLSVFWSSKILNIFIIGLVLLSFKLLFKKNAYLYSLIFFFASYIKIFSLTWSETIFIFFLYTFAISIYYFLTTSKHLYLVSFAILLTSISLFLSRYIGAFSFGLIGLLGLYYWFIKKEISKSLILVSIASINIILMIIYLNHNYHLSGFKTGMLRVSSSDSTLDFVIQFLKAILVESIIPYTNKHILTKVILFLVVQYSILIYIILKNKIQIIQPNNLKTYFKTISISYVFFIIGLTYILIISFFRWFYMFDDLGERLLAPGSFLLFIALISFLENNSTLLFFKKIKLFLVGISIFSWSINVIYPIVSVHYYTKNYNEVINEIEQKYSKIEKNSIIIFGTDHLRYLRIDLQLQNPMKNEHWNDFINRLKEGHNNIYLDTSKGIKDYDETIVAVIKKYEPNSLIKIN